MRDQEQCDRMKQVCIDNGLPYWDDEIAFELNDLESVFGCSGGDFFIFDLWTNDPYTQVTEAEFMNLLKEYKNGNVLLSNGNNF